MIHLENSSLKVLIHKTILNLQEKLAPLTSSTTQQHFPVLKQKADAILGALDRRDCHCHSPFIPVYCARLRLVHVLYCLLAVVLAGFAYSCMGWNQPLFDCIVNQASKLDQTGALFQRLNTHMQRFGLSVLFGNPKLTKYPSASLLLGYATSISQTITYPEDFFGNHKLISDFHNDLMSYNICSLEEIVAVPEIAELCRQLNLSSGVYDSDSFPFPDPENDSQIGKSVVSLRFLITLVKNQMTEIATIIGSSAFKAVTPSVLRPYMQTCLTISNYLYAWSLFREMAMVP